MTPFPDDSDAARESRVEFLARIRDAVDPARSVAGEPEAPAVDQRLVRLAPRGLDQVTLFAERAGTAGMRVARCSGHELAGVLSALLAGLNLRRIAVRVADPTLARAADEAASALDIHRYAPVDDDRLDGYFDLDAGITDVTSAVAESGTLVLSSDLHGRAAHLVPPIHIALVPASAIVPDMLDLWPCGAAAVPLPACLTLVTGPSKTADIEGVLVTGVHGPREVHVIIVDAPARAAGAPREEPS